MEILDLNKIKFKNIPKKNLILSLDRLTRFKHPSIKFQRIFFDIISKFLICPKYNFEKLNSLPPEQIGKLVKTIWNASVQALNPDFIPSFKLNKILIKESTELYNITNSCTKTLMNEDLNIEGLVDIIKNDKNLPFNLQRLIYLNENNSVKVREKGFKFPITKILLAEGATEEILLPEFSKLLDYNFDKNGVYIISAGGKNQVAKKYMEYKEQIKVPIMILLDSDAKEIQEIIEPKLRKFDKIYLLKKGEFEDIIPLSLIKRTINNDHKNEFQIHIAEIKNSSKMCKTIAETLRTHGGGDFKKADFAKSVAQNITKSTKLDDEMIEFFKELKEL